MARTKQPRRIIRSAFGMGDQSNSANTQQSSDERDFEPRLTIEKVMAGDGTADGRKIVVQSQV